MPDPERLEEEGHQKYKKGYELRFTARTQTELKKVRGLLARAGYRPGNPYGKGQQWIQPVYGREAVERFCKVYERQAGKRGSKTSTERAAGMTRRPKTG